MDELIDDFLAETRDMLQALAGAIVAWEADPDDRERLDEIFRFVHTVKGNCGFFDLPRLKQLSHAAEDVLADVRAGRRIPDFALVSAVLGIIDRIGELVLALETGEAVASEDDEQLIAALSEEPAQAASAVIAAPAERVEGDRRKAVRSIRLSVDLLDRMMSGVSDAVLARNELSRRLRDMPRDVAVEAAFERMSGCIAEIRDAITRTRMQRIDSLFSALPRMVRDLSTELGKQVLLEMDGGDVELDREMLEMIRDPLTHIIRNAIDHGLEAPEDRAAAGKAKAGRLAVAARQSGNQILIEICDDGRGIDGAALVRKALALGLIDAACAETMTPAQKVDLIFSAGLSTAGAVTAISGRGVGMDVVRANVERIGGLIDVESRPGQGVRLSIRVPLTLTIISALTVSAGGQVFAIPRSAIDEILRANGDAVRMERVGDADLATVRGRRMPLVALSGLLSLAAEAEPEARKLVLLKPAGGDLYALAVDAVHDHEELVVKPASPLVMAAGVYAGTTLADDGRPILVLDPGGMAKAAQLRFEAADAERLRPEAEADAVAETPMLFFRTLDGAARAVPVPLVERIEDVAAEAVRFSAGMLRVALGERIVPLAGCAAPPDTAKLRILRLTDGASELAYAFSEVIDIRALTLDLSPASAPGEVAGVALVDGHQVELLDVHWLFATFAQASGDDRPTCALPSGDPWINNMLRPLIESLGYAIVTAGDDVVADIAIETDGETGPDRAAAVVRLRNDPQPAGEGDDSIYRYDRAALLSALHAARRRAYG